MIKRKINRAQVTLEFTALIVIISATLLGMMHYVRRAAQGRMREAADSIGGQYDPRRITSDITISQRGTVNIESRQVREPEARAEEGLIDGVRTVTTVTGESMGKAGTETLPEYPNDGNLFN